MKNKVKTLLLALLLAVSSLPAMAQNLHPYKMKFADYESWKTTKPADINFKNFRPYRAVYNRTYTNARNETVNDQVIMIAQRAWWYGKKVILFEFQDSGTPDFKDTNGRTQFYYLDETTLQMYLAVGPKVTTPEDYTTVRVLDDKIAVSRLNTATGKADFKEVPNSSPTFAFRQLRFLMWAAMDLKVGEKIKLQPIFNAPQGGHSLALGTVEEQADYTTPDGKKYRPFIIDNTNNPTNAIVHKFYVINEAPYLLAQGLYNADDKKIYRWWLKLTEFEYLDAK